MLDLIPEHQVEWEIDQEGLVTIKVLKATNKLFQSFISFLGYDLFRKIHLDSYGSFVWMQIDGRQNFGQIAEKMKTEFGDSIEPVYERLGTYARTLISQRFVKIPSITK